MFFNDRLIWRSCDQSVFDYNRNTFSHNLALCTQNGYKEAASMEALVSREYLSQEINRAL